VSAHIFKNGKRTASLEVKVGEKIYRRNTVYGTYNSIDDNSLLFVHDADKIRATKDWRMAGGGDTPKNCVDEIKQKFGKEIKDFGITEIFVVDGEVHITSNYEVPADLVDKIEKEIK